MVTEHALNRVRVRDSETKALPRGGNTAASLGHVGRLSKGLPGSGRVRAAHPRGQGAPGAQSAWARLTA